jgi:Methyltransferase FkbM domain
MPEFETAELEFTQRFLQPGMTVLDIGANCRLYTLLPAHRVGTSDRVFAFQPSPRERKRLMPTGVDVCTMDDFLNRENLTREHFIEMDVEGNELEVLQIVSQCNSVREKFQ